MKLTTNFYSTEFQCRHCGKYLDSTHIALQLQRFRNWVNAMVKSTKEIRFIVHCGLRCVEHNENVGGVSNSRHLPKWYEKRQGAADFHATVISNKKLAKLAKKAWRIGVLTGGLGIYKWGVHVDCSSRRQW